MRSKILATGLLAGLAVVAMSTGASAIPSPAKVQAGGCTGPYTEVARVAGQAICLYNYDPRAYANANGTPCAAGDTELFSVLRTVYVCYGL